MKDDAYWARRTLPKMGDQTDPYPVDMHPNAMKLRDQHASFHEY